jgi:hypothetical protein
MRSAGDNAIGTYFRLSDGAVLWILDGEVRNRLGQGFPEGIEPDVTLLSQESTVLPGSDAVVIGAEIQLAQILSHRAK